MDTSVIIPVYNAEKTIRQCVDSILSQTYGSFELILVDDGSKDNSLDICNEYALKDDRVRVVHKENGGVSSARNRGLDIAEGEWVTFIDADDYIEKNFLINLYDAKEDIIVCSYQNLKTNIIVERFNISDTMPGTLSEFIEEYITNTILRGPVAKFYKKSLIGNLKFPENMKVGEDSCFVFKYLSKCQTFKMLSNSIYTVRLSEEMAESKYRISVDYALSSLFQLQKAFDELNQVHRVGKDKFFSYIGYFKRISYADWGKDTRRWYKDKRVIELYKYVWEDLSILQKIRLVVSWILLKK